MIGALARARRLAAARRAELDRRFRDDPRLVRAWCRLCGGEVEQGSGFAITLNWAEFDAREAAADRGREGLSQPVYADWSRQHDGCQADSSWVFEQVLGEPLSPSEARRLGEVVRVPAAFQVPVLQHEALGPRRGAWAHVTVEQREHIRAALVRLREEETQKTAPGGACGVCGRAASTSWRQSRSVRWGDDGSLAWLCASCQGIEFPGDGMARPIQTIREKALRAITGLTELAVPQFGMKLAAEVPAARRGESEPFIYSPALEAIKAAAWTWRPSAAPEEHRDHYQRLHDEREAEILRERADIERADRQARTLATSPLGGSIEW